MPWSREMWFWCPGAPFTGREIAPGQAYGGIFYTLPGVSPEGLYGGDRLGQLFPSGGGNTAMCSADREVRIVQLLETPTGLPGGPRLRPGAAGQGPGDCF